MRFDLVHRRLVDQRSLGHTLFQSVAHFELVLHRLREPARKLVVDPILNQKAIGADAGLAAVAILGSHRPLDCRIQIGVVEDDEGGVAAQFQRDLLDRARALLHQQLANRCRAGKAELSHDRTGGHLTADRLCIPGHDT